MIMVKWEGLWNDGKRQSHVLVHFCCHNRKLGEKRHPCLTLWRLTNVPESAQVLLVDPSRVGDIIQTELSLLRVTVIIT